ncbi:hypothetical protein LCD36_01965 [Saccharopolyspora sp. 6T]|uniref:hypothetical protein n=1 Tax=Saccharopolyspora sp. 6T TaxID=2877238 RepID=UPI001CD3A8F4|nr:hypothetical protein [Saccharopolyspora sp. 6T]MCA1185207.1 hypothetical protein [Saccharopolyspora sp. 6T]
MVRAALWLESEVGEGEVFSKRKLRDAFPETAQIDRRVRDLRDHGWRIDTSREDPSLRQEEQRYAKRGDEVWLSRRGKPAAKAPLTTAQRSKILAADNHLCRSCGVAAGDFYEDGVLSAQLDITRRRVSNLDGTVEVQLITECNRCRVGGRGTQADLAKIIDALSLLGPLERQIFARWVRDDTREFNGIEKLWGRYRALPAEARSTVESAVSGHGKSDGK